MKTIINLKDTNPYHTHICSFAYGNICDAWARASGIESYEELRLKSKLAKKDMPLQGE